MTESEIQVALTVVGFIGSVVGSIVTRIMLLSRIRAAENVTILELTDRRNGDPRFYRNIKVQAPTTNAAKLVMDWALRLEHPGQKFTVAPPPIEVDWDTGKKQPEGHGGPGRS